MKNANSESMDIEKNSNLSENVKNFKDKASELGRDFKGLGEASKNLAQGTLYYVKDNAAEYYQRGMQKAHQLEEGLESKVRERPFTSLLIAAGVGYLFSLLWRRR